MVVECQNERSQFQNKDKALEILRSRLLAQKQKEQQDAINASRAGAGGHRRPQRKNPHLQLPAGPLHRPPHRPDGPQSGKIMDGNLDEIIDALATREQAEKLQLTHRLNELR